MNRTARIFLFTVSALNGIAGLVCGVLFLVSPDGSLLGFEPLLDVIATLPFANVFFRDLIWIGIAMLLVLALPNLVALLLLVRRDARQYAATGAAAVLLLLWCGFELVFMFNAGAVGYFLVGVLAAGATAFLGRPQMGRLAPMAWRARAVIARGPPGCSLAAQPEGKPATGSESESTATSAAETSCTPTAPNGATPPGEPPASVYLGNGELFTTLWPEGTVVFEPGGPGEIAQDGTLSMKWPFWRGEGVDGTLTIEGRSLHRPGLRVTGDVPDGYGTTGFQATGLTFPEPGCWEVTARAGDASLTFVTRVELRQ